MSSRPATLQLPRQITATYLLFGLASAWLGIAVAAWEARPHSLPLAVGSLSVIVVGAAALYWRMRRIAAIEDQLRAIARSAPAGDTVKCVPQVDSITEGWNRLVDEYQDLRGQTVLETRLGAALDRFREQRSDQILNSLPDGIVLTDDEGRVVFANAAVAAVLGRQGGAGDLTGKTMEDLLGLGSDAEHNPFLDPGARLRTVQIEMGRTGDTAQGVLRIARHPLRATRGSDQAGHVWSIRDVTQQKLAEQMRNQFVNAATHELRTPLTNIKAYAECLVLSEMLDVEKQKEFCNTINAEATRLARLIDDLLNISRMEAGSLALARHATNMERLFQEVLEKVRPQAIQKRIALRSALPEKLSKVAVDKDKFVAALVNLLGNAIKYTPEGGQVSFKVQVSGNTLQIDVEDTGYGISAAELPKIFDKFFRSSDPRVQQQTGSGLGLALVQEVIRLHGGTVQVRSELDKGTRFIVTLPLA